MGDHLNSSMLEFLTWVANRRRTYDEAAEAWRSTCPRHTVWEDAFIEGYVRLETPSTGICELTLTPEGRIALNRAAPEIKVYRATAA
jgi:hypothetical protein